MIRIIIILSAILFASPVYSEQKRYVETPYGTKYFDDHDASKGLLHWLPQRTGDNAVDSVNSDVLMRVCEVSDGILSEIMGDVCTDDFINKPDIIAHIYKNGDSKLLDLYLDAIARELALGHTGQNDEFAQLKKSVLHNLTDKSCENEIRSILNIIKNKYIKYLE